MKYVYEVDGFKFNYWQPAVEWLVASKGLDDSPAAKSVDFSYYKTLLHFLEKEASVRGFYEDPWTGIKVELRR
jgi:hypothetical protein